MTSTDFVGLPPDAIMLVHAQCDSVSQALLPLVCKYFSLLHLKAPFAPPPDSLLETVLLAGDVNLARWFVSANFAPVSPRYLGLAVLESGNLPTIDWFLDEFMHKQWIFRVKHMNALAESSSISAILHVLDRLDSELLSLRFTIPFPFLSN